MSKLNEKEKEFIEKVNELIKVNSISEIKIDTTLSDGCFWKSFLQDVFEIDFESFINVEVKPVYFSIKFEDVFIGERFYILYKVYLKPDGNVDFSKVYKLTYIPKD